MFYALDVNDRLVYADLASKNQKYICTACREIVKPKQGYKNRWHFAHEPESNCSYGYETSLHYLAKEIISEADKMYFPAVRDDMNTMIKSAQTISIDDVKLETVENEIIPDIVLYSDNIKIYVEIRVTHPINNDKLNKIKKNKVPTLEIDLSKTDRNIDKETLEKILLKNSLSKDWIYHPAIEEYYAGIQQTERIKREKRKKDYEKTIKKICPKCNNELGIVRFYIKNEPYLSFLCECGYKLMVNNCPKCGKGDLLFDKDKKLLRCHNCDYAISSNSNVGRYMKAINDPQILQIKMVKNCPYCEGEIVLRKNNYSFSPFLACENYGCYTSSINVLDDLCPKCKTGYLKIKHGQYGLYAECDNSRCSKIYSYNTKEYKKAKKAQDISKN